MLTTVKTPETPVQIYQTPSGWYAQGTVGSDYDTCRYRFVKNAPQVAFWATDQYLDERIQAGDLEQIEGVFL